MNRRRMIVCSIAAAFALQASAATTWTSAAAGSKSAVASVTTGTEVPAQPSGAYAAGTTYDAGDVVTYGGAPYVSLQATNVGHNPAAASSADWWRIVGVEVYRTATLKFTVCTDREAGSTISDGNGFDLWVWDPVVGLWSKANRTPYVSAEGAGVMCAEVLGESPVLGFPNFYDAQKIRVALLPNGAATSNLGASNPMKIWHELLTGSGVIL